MTPENNESYQQATVLSIPNSEESSYTVQLNSDQTIVQVPESQMSTTPPTSNLTNNPSPPDLPSWIKDEACTTIYLHGMNKPERGKLVYDKDEQQWYFRQGRKESNPKRHLPDFESTCRQGGEKQ